MLRNKKVVIIGGSSGIGLAAAKAAAVEHALVVIASRSTDKLARAADEIEGEVETYPLDITSEYEVEMFFAELGVIDHLVVTAASGSTGNFLEIETVDARKVMEGKFWGQYMAARYAAPRVLESGSITLFSGIASEKPIAGFSSFAMVNGAINALCRALAVEIAPIRVNAVSPGIVDTPAYAEMDPRERRYFFESIARRAPVQRIGRPEDVALAVLYLMKNGNVTGEVIHVDGGMRIH